MSRGKAWYHLLVYASYTWKFSFKKNCNCNWFMLHKQNLKRLIDTEWDCYLMVSTLSFLNFDLYQYFVIFFFFFFHKGMLYYIVYTHLIIILCTYQKKNYLMHNIYILVESTFCKMCILMLHPSFLFTQHMPLYIMYAYNNYLSSLLICVAFIVMWDPQIVRKMMHILIIPIFHLWDEIPSCTYTTLSCWWKVNCLGKMRWYDFIFYIYIFYFLLGYR